MGVWVGGPGMVGRCRGSQSPYTHRVAISNSRLLHYDRDSVTFKWKDYRAPGRYRHKKMTLEAPEFIRRFLIHVLPPSFHRIRHFGLFANHQRQRQLRTLRQLLDAVEPPDVHEKLSPPPSFICRSCGSPLIIVERFDRPQTRAPPQ